MGACMLLSSEIRAILRAMAMSWSRVLVSGGCTALVVAALGCKSDGDGERRRSVPALPAQTEAPVASPTDNDPASPAQEAVPDCVLIEHGFGPEKGGIAAEVVIDGLEVPWGIAFLPGGDWLITERPGRVRLVRNGALVQKPVATIAASARAEGGLLGIAAHPDFQTNRWFYIYYTTRNQGGARNRVERWVLSRDHRSASRDRVIVEDIPAARFHDGGRIKFGPDGMLYIGTGDATEPEQAQDRSSLAGKILRVTESGAIPEDNPFPKSPVYVLGVRNVEGFDFGPNGLLYVADHGPSGELGRSGHDEISVAKAGDNLGWPTIYGCQQKAGMVTPVLTWREAVPPGGAAIYTGDALAGWQGDFLVSSLGSRHLHRIDFSAQDPTAMVAHGVYLAGEPPQGFGRLRVATMGPDGALYLATSNCDGRGRCPSGGDKILRVIPERGGARDAR